MEYRNTYIIELVKKTPEVLLAVDINGKIRKCVPFLNSISKFSLQDSFHLIKKETMRGFAVGFLQQDVNMDEKKLQKKVQDLVEGLKYSKIHKLEPGVNIPGNKRYHLIKKKLAKELTKNKGTK